MPSGCPRVPAPPLQVEPSCGGAGNGPVRGELGSGVQTERDLHTHTAGRGIPCSAAPPLRSVHRLGQKRDVHVFRYYAEDSVEERILVRRRMRC